jgi:hypothetical protein
MYRLSTLQKPDAQFIAEAKLINAQVHLHEVDWGTDPQRVFQFDNLLGSAVNSYEANLDPAMKNAATAIAKRADFAELKNFLSLFIDYLEGNTLVPDAALETMGLRPRHPQAHQPLPAPPYPPVITVRKQHGEITVYAARTEHDHPTDTVGPVHYHGFLLYYKFEGEAEYKSVVSTRLHQTLYPGPEDDGKRILLKAAWVNSRMQHGPWSNEISEIVG